jgi:hypothetical protein
MTIDTRPPNIPPWERLGEFERTVVLAVSKIITLVDSDDELADKIEELLGEPEEVGELSEEEWAKRFNVIHDRVIRKACQSLYQGINGTTDKIFYYAVEMSSDEDD